MSEPNVHTAINQVMHAVGYVQKTRAGGLGYSFAGEAALIAGLRPPMVEAGLYCAVVGIQDVTRGTYTTAKGNVMNIVDLTAVVRFTHAPSATHIDVVALGSGADSGDKASNKALTGAYKYALRQTFCIETGDDPDNTPSRPRAIKQVEPTTGEITETKPTNGHTTPKVEAPPVGGRPFAAEVVKAKVEAGAKKHASRAASKEQRGLLVGMLAECYPGDASDEARHMALEYLTGAASSKDVPDAYVHALLDWLKPEKDSGGAYQPAAMAKREAALVLRAARVEAGQAELAI